MPINRQIDIRGVDWPIGILNCQKEVNQMKAGEQIELLVQDIDVINNIATLIKQLSGHSIEKQNENKHYRLIIKKS